jgi:hypothetical protein
VLRRPRKPRLKEWEMDYEFYIGDGLVRGVDWDRTPSSGEIACGQCERYRIAGFANKDGYIDLLNFVSSRYIKQ